VLAASGLLACESEPPAGADVTAARIADDPGAFVGQTVTVGGEVERTAGPRAYTLDGGFGGRDLLVLGAQPREEGEEAVVTGRVRLLEVAEVERELGWDLDTELEVEFAQQPVLIASVPAPRAQADAGDGEPREARAGGAQPITDVATIAKASDASTLVGRSVRFDDVPVSAVTADRGFWLGGAEDGVYARLTPRLNQGKAEWAVDGDANQKRTLRGTIEKLPPIEQMKTEWGLTDADASKVAEGELYVRVEKLEETLQDVPPANANAG